MTADPLLLEACAVLLEGWSPRVWYTHESGARVEVVVLEPDGRPEGARRGPWTLMPVSGVWPPETIMGGRPLCVEDLCPLLPDGSSLRAALALGACWRALRRTG